jgi:hypothetical protein
MPRLSFKPDSSFFRKIAIGAVGANAVILQLNSWGHHMIELENGSTHTKIWKDVKRKRVRIPDLICTNCGLRVECRAKTSRNIAMSHSFNDAERAWDFGLVDDDIVAFPVCQASDEYNWTNEKFSNNNSYFHSRDRVRWVASNYINFIDVRNMRSVIHSKHSQKGVTEGSETSIEWDAILSSRNGLVEYIEDRKIGIRRHSDGHLYVWQNKKNLPVRVNEGSQVFEKQIIASHLKPIDHNELICSNNLIEENLLNLISSPERTQRFSGVRLARYTNESNLQDLILNVTNHPNEDLYVKLEGIIYLSTVCKMPVNDLISPFLNNVDQQIQLEAIVALSEIQNDMVVEILDRKLSSSSSPYFIRSASAWALGRIGSERAINCLINAFSDININIREEALNALEDISGNQMVSIYRKLNDNDSNIAAGVAEVIRRKSKMTRIDTARIAKLLDESQSSIWPIWLLGQFPEEKDLIRIELSNLQDNNPDAHYAISLLWTFMESWIANYWELNPSPKYIPQEVNNNGREFDED